MATSSSECKLKLQASDGEIVEVDGSIFKRSMLAGQLRVSLTNITELFSFSLKISTKINPMILSRYQILTQQL